MFGHKLKVGHSGSYFMISWFCLKHWKLFAVSTWWLGMKSQFDQMFDLKLLHCSRSYWPISDGSEILPYILITIWCTNMFAWNNDSVWPNFWPQTNSRSQWPIYFRIQWVCLICWLLFDVQTCLLEIMTQCAQCFTSD